MHTHKKIRTGVLCLTAILLAFLCLFAGCTGMSVHDCIRALFGNGSDYAVRIIRNIRLPRVLAAVIAGGGLSVSGLIMQTVLDNPMASPSTLGVSKAAVFGANLSILLLAGGKTVPRGASFDPFACSAVAFLFSVLSVLLILGLCRKQDWQPGSVVLAGVAMGSVWTACTTILQFYATEEGLSAAVIWDFGDLGRATYRTDCLMFAVVAVSAIVFRLFAWKYNALLCGDAAASSMGIHVDRLRILSLLLASVITAVCVSVLGSIGFVGIICPHIVKKIFGQDHRFCIPASLWMGSILLTAADTVSRTVGGGSAVPVGAVTTLLGAPFFLFLIVFGGGKKKC